MRVLLTPKHIRFISLILGLVTFIIVLFFLLFFLPGCAGAPAAWVPALEEEEAAHPPLGRVAYDSDAVGR